MITAWDIYWITRLDGIRDCVEPVMVLGCLALFISVVAIIYGCSEEEPTPRRLGIIGASIVAPTMILAASVWVFVPSMKEAAAIYLIPHIAANEDVQ